MGEVTNEEDFEGKIRECKKMNGANGEGEETKISPMQWCGAGKLLEGWPARKLSVRAKMSPSIKHVHTVLHSWVMDGKSY